VLIVLAVFLLKNAAADAEGGRRAVGRYQVLGDGMGDEGRATQQPQRRWRIAATGAGRLLLAAVVVAGCAAETTGTAGPVDASEVELVTGPPESVTAGDERPVVVRARSAVGAWAEICGTVQAGGGAVTPGVAATNAEGVASVTWQMGGGNVVASTMALVPRTSPSVEPGLSSSTTYWCQAAACNAGGCSDWSEAAGMATMGALLGLSLGPEQFATIPVGSFDMGSNAGYSQERPVHRVTLTRAFELQRAGVTQAQWREVMGTNPSLFSGCDRCPVEMVSWDDIQAS